MITLDEKYMYDENGDINQKALSRVIKRHQSEIERLQKLNDYYEGRHNILNREMKYTDVNNKVVVNFAEYITGIATGYVHGKPVGYSCENKEFEKINDEFIKIDEDSHNFELGEDISVFGKAYEQVYMSNDVTPQFRLAKLSVLNTFIVYSQDVSHRKLFAVSIFEDRDLDDIKKGYDVYVYTDTYKYHYYVTDLNTESFMLVEDGIKEHFFKEVPIVRYLNQARERGDFESAISMIDAYNMLQSDRVNDVQKFVDSVLVIIGQSLGDTKDEVSETAKALKELKCLNLDEDGDAKYITNSLTQSEIEVLKDAIKQDIHKISKIPDMSDENFANNSSGVAMKFKLFGTEQLGNTKERYFKKGLRERLELICNIEGIRANNISPQDVDIKMKRTLPVDDTERLSMLQGTADVLSWETRVKMFDEEIDIDAERKRLDDEKKANIELQRQSMIGYDFDKEDEEEDVK